MGKIFRSACLVLVLAVIFPASAGCSGAGMDLAAYPGSDGAGAAVLAGSAGGAAGSARSDLPREVRITGYLVGNTLPGFPKVLSELNKKLKRDVNARMEINYVNWGELQAKYPLILAAGENVDWVFTASWAFYPQLAAKGAFLEITGEMLAKYMPRHYALLKGTTALKEARINGRVYMVPTATPDRKVPVFIYREDLRRKYGIPEIKRFSDIEPYLEAIKANEPGMTPMNLGSNYDLVQPHAYLVSEQYDLVQDIFITTSGGSGIVYDPLDTDGKLYYVTQDPIMGAYEKAADTMKAWYDRGYINKDAFANRVRSKESFVQGKSAIGIGNSIDIQGNISQAMANGFGVGLVPIVSGKSQKALKDPYIGNGIAIAANSKNPGRTMMALDLMMEDENYINLEYFGIEGTHYAVKDGKIDLLEGDPQGSGSYPPDQAGFWFINKDVFKPLSSWLPSYIELKGRLQSMLAPNIYAAFAPATDNIKTETENCNQIIIQYLNPIQLGAFKNADDSFKTLDDRLRSAGIERIMAEMERQSKAFLAEQN